mmetsp:Transcript_10621/g.30045  ORF Transcript_10621/g.30045 Transcript_10621/m.30045 type:complete len:200 (+) Transcript_10621:364-963(+)
MFLRARPQSLCNEGLRIGSNVHALRHVMKLLCQSANILALFCIELRDSLKRLPNSRSPGLLKHLELLTELFPAAPVLELSLPRLVNYLAVKALRFECSVHCHVRSGDKLGLFWPSSAAVSRFHGSFRILASLQILLPRALENEILGVEELVEPRHLGLHCSMHVLLLLAERLELAPECCKFLSDDHFALDEIVPKHDPK